MLYLSDQAKNVMCNMGYAPDLKIKALTSILLTGLLLLCPLPAPLEWLVSKPVWVEQWPLNKEKSDALH